jgi:hypothetical protein
VLHLLYDSLVPTSIYIESSIIGYLTARPSRDVIAAARQAITVDWWEKHRHRYDVYVSALVEQEIAGGDEEAANQRMLAVANIASVAVTAEAQVLAETLLRAKAIPANSVEDALHIAIAATQGADFLLTWNFKHINNAETKLLIAKAVESAGYVCPILCSPEELGGVRDE